jgi:uncharacterized protein (UPF0147 family)
VGALHGASALRAEWIAQVEDANRDIFAEVHGDTERNFRHMARESVTALHNEQHRTATRAAQLERMLGD